MLFKSECRFFKKPLSLNYSTQNGVRYRFKNGVRLDDGSYHLDNGIVIKSSVHPADIAGLLGARTLYNLYCAPSGGITGKDNVELYMNGDEFAPKNLDEKQVEMGFGEKQHLSNVIGLGLRFPSLFDYACQYQYVMNTRNRPEFNHRAKCF